MSHCPLNWSFSWDSPKGAEEEGLFGFCYPILLPQVQNKQHRQWMSNLNVSFSQCLTLHSQSRKNSCVQWHVGGRPIITSEMLASDLMRLCQTVCLRKQNSNHFLVLFCVLAYWFSFHIFPVFCPREEPTAAHTTIKWKHKPFDRLLWLHYYLQQLQDYPEIKEA